MSMHNSAIAYRSDELAIDRGLHVLGLLAGGLGSGLLSGLAVFRLDHFRAGSVILYSLCLIAMLVCSAAYNFADHSPRRQLLRRLDHAMIFILIAGTYTPFLVRAFPEVWAVVMISAVWAMAVVGGLLKLCWPHRLERIDLLLYLGLGWIILGAWRQLSVSVGATAVSLIIWGGLLYTVGAGFHAWRRLRYQNAIWHAFVLVAAGCHYAAVLDGVVLASARS